MASRAPPARVALFDGFAKPEATHMRVDLRRGKVRMAEQILDGPKIRSALKHAR